MDRVPSQNKREILNEALKRRMFQTIFVTLCSPLLGIPIDVAFARMDWYSKGWDPIVSQPLPSPEEWFTTHYWNLVRKHLGITTI